MFMSARILFTRSSSLLFNTGALLSRSLNRVPAVAISLKNTEKRHRKDTRIYALRIYALRIMLSRDANIPFVVSRAFGGNEHLLNASTAPEAGHSTISGLNS